MRDALDIGFGDIIFPEVRPEFFGVVGSDQITDKFFDFTRPVGFIAESPHVPLRQEPVAETDAAEHDFIALLIHDILALCVQESEGGRRVRREQREAENPEQPNTAPKQNRPGGPY